MIWNLKVSQTIYIYIQEDLEDSFAPSLIQRMELTVLKALDWRVDSTTPFSYIHLLTQTTHDHASNTNKTLIQHRVTHLLLDALLGTNHNSKKFTIIHSLISCEEYAILYNLNNNDDQIQDSWSSHNLLWQSQPSKLCSKIHLHLHHHHQQQQQQQIMLPLHI